jgi:hypothetical protein
VGQGEGEEGGIRAHRTLSLVRYFTSHDSYRVWGVLFVFHTEFNGLRQRYCEITDFNYYSTSSPFSPTSLPISPTTQPRP